MINTFSETIIVPYLYSCANIVTEVNKEFLDLTEYTWSELVGKPIKEVGNMLRFNLYPLEYKLNNKYSGYIFTKFLNALEVDILISIGSETNSKLYTFVEKPNSRLNDKLIFVEQMFIDNISGVAVYSVPDLILLKANQKYLNFTYSNYNKEENSIGKPIGEVITGFAETPTEVIFNSVLISKKTSYIKEFEFDNITKGKTYWDSTQTPIFDNGRMKYIFHTAVEVTHRVLKNQNIERQNRIISHQNECLEHEEAIKRRFEILKRVINTFDLPVVRLSCPDLKIIAINKKALNTIKLIKPEFITNTNIKNNTMKFLLGLLQTTEYDRRISGVLKEKKTKYLNKQHYVINGNELYFNIIFEPVLEVNGEIQEILILVIDVTPEIKSNINMKEVLKSQGEFLVNISHELKTPLNVIFATAQLFNVYCESGSLDENKDSIIKYIDSIKQNSYRLSKMINNIVDLSKIEAGFFKLNLSNNDIVKFVEDIVMSVTNFTDSKGLNIIFDTNTEEKIIAYDPEKIERVVLNLISNAIKFSDAGNEILVNVNDKNEFIEISVKDNGIGIEKKYLDMIFDRFKQVDKSLSRNAEGTGIGLSLVKSIVELHDGTITVESQYGTGSRFTVSIPSKNVSNENKIYNSEVRGKDQSIRVELSDVYS
ncbi:PAS domain-containing sensor histidine kinase [Clostridium estertheticum]|uniref:PAS domain-containing sensor histidine kinase n=1 Tax=Clostridium estertheticum TaxID=238834 RepID=UPI00217E469D|nr:PAS domain-containing sensor histidine kinase [Clostridium estertheticum]